MIGKNIKAIKSDLLSNLYNPRYIIINIETGEILDDAQGYGYKTQEGAYAAYSWKHRDKSKDKEKRKYKKEVRKWIKSKAGLEDLILQDCFDAYKCGIEYKTKNLKELFTKIGIKCPYKVSEVLKVWQKMN